MLKNFRTTRDAKATALLRPRHGVHDHNHVYDYGQHSGLQMPTIEGTAVSRGSWCPLQSFKTGGRARQHKFLDSIFSVNEERVPRALNSIVQYVLFQHIADANVGISGTICDRKFFSDISSYQQAAVLAGTESVLYEVSISRLTLSFEVLYLVLSSLLSIHVITESTALSLVIEFS